MQFNLALSTPLSEVELKRQEILGEDWFVALRDVLNSPKVRSVATHVSKRRQETTVYPEQKDTFRAFKVTPYKDVKVVIIGQDPYHNGHADGLCFSSRNEEQTPKSLEIVFKAINESCKLFPTSNDLTTWAEQGILLLNKVLTVEKGEPNSHKGLGWEELTGTAIRALSNKETPVCYLLWGADAKELKRFIVNPRHLVIEAEHPMASEYAGRTWNYGNCFEKCNEFLKLHGLEPIKWESPNYLPF